MTTPFVLVQHILPQHAISRLAGALAASERSWLKHQLIRRFAAAYDVDLSDAARGLAEFVSFNDFFTRELRPGARPLADSAQFVLSPADGTISQLGTITRGRIFQAKGRDFSVRELLGHDEETAAHFEGGRFVTIYLSPRDYHRVHMPAAGALHSTAYIPGDLFSVNQQTAEGVDRLFARNERLACLFEGPVGRFASVMVGAMIVAGISTVWPRRSSEDANRVIRESFTTNPWIFKAGDEMGQFHLGSTVVLLLEPGRAEWLGAMQAGTKVRMGQAIASYYAQSG
jgi:phosphatidylserine decarboxylase